MGSNVVCSTGLGNARASESGTDSMGSHAFSCLNRIQYDMDSLPNENTRRGGINPSHVGLTSSVSPKVPSLKAKNSDTGVSSDCVPIEKRCWLVFRATYGRSEKACAELQSQNIETYLPMRYAVREVEGRRKRVLEPLIPGIIFVRTTPEAADRLVMQSVQTSQYLKYYRDKTRPAEAGLNPPLQVRDDDMENFIRLTSVKSEHTMVVPSGKCRLKSGDAVRVVKGDFAGVTGKVARIAGQQRVVMEIPGFGHVATAFIPSAFIEKL